MELVVLVAVAALMIWSGLLNEREARAARRWQLERRRTFLRFLRNVRRARQSD